MHDLDTCEVTVEEEELNPDHERLEVDVACLQQKGIEVSHSDLGVVFTGEKLERVFCLCFLLRKPHMCGPLA